MVILNYCKNYGSSDQLTCIGNSGSNCSALYLYSATQAGLSVTPLMHMHQYKRGITLVRQCPYPALLLLTRSIKVYHHVQLGTVIYLIAFGYTAGGSLKLAAFFTIIASFPVLPVVMWYSIWELSFYVFCETRYFYCRWWWQPFLIRLLVWEKPRLHYDFTVIYHLSKPDINIIVQLLVIWGFKTFNKSYLWICSLPPNNVSFSNT